MSKDFTPRRQPTEVSNPIERANRDIKAATIPPSFANLMQETKPPMSAGFSKQMQDAMSPMTSGLLRQMRSATAPLSSFDAAVGVKTMKAFEAKMAGPHLDCLDQPMVSTTMPPPYDAETAANTAAMADVLPDIVQSVQSLQNQQERTTTAVEELKKSQLPKWLAIPTAIFSIIGVVATVAAVLRALGITL